MALIDKLTAIADEIRDKTGGTAKLGLADMVTEIRKLCLLSSSTPGDATAAHILSGKKAWVAGSQITGTMTNQGAKTSSLNCGGSYTIPAGYHNGSGKITANSLASQTDGDATAAQILTGKIAWVDGAKVTGTMTNNGAVSQALAINGSYTIPAGYHNGSGKVTQSITTKAAATYGAKTSAQTIAAGQYLSGKQTIAAVTQTNLIAANIVKGTTVTIASNGSNLWSVTGTATPMSGNAIYYLNGADKCTSLTGGWGAGYNTSYYTPLSTNQGLQFYDPSNKKGWHGTVTNSKIDVTNLANITFIVYAPNHFYVNYFYIGLYDTRTQVYNQQTLGANVTWTDVGDNDPYYKIINLDVSEITGSYYLGAYYYTYLNYNNKDRYGILTKVIGVELT